MHEVKLVGSLRDTVDGAASVTIEAATIRELFLHLAERYPRIQNHIDAGIAVSINGEIYRDNWSKLIPEGAEVYLLQRIEGG
ncbi:MAG: molybdopterin synthase sulfur carrier subunit [Gammaproteobacteria bacterium]|jgi:molybdopterin synthase sulfur carrier subunit